MYNIYFAGDLFDHKHLTGNKVLADQIELLSNKTYTCTLPQEWEGSLRSGSNFRIDTRNRDIRAVAQADLVLFNFDGPDLDSGTVVEFIIAKMLDIPAVLLRTDCRNGAHFGYDWNLMVDNYPRCLILKHPALLMSNQMELNQMHQTIAQSVISAFESVRQEQSLLSSYDEIMSGYKYVIKMCGAGLENDLSSAALDKIISSKIAKKMYTFLPTPAAAATSAAAGRTFSSKS